MSKKNVFREKWQSNKTKGGAIPLLGVSVIVFVLTIAVYFVASYVAASLPKENTLSNWEYLYTTRPGATPAGELRIFNAQNPILTEKGVKRENLYLTKTIDPKDSGKTLVILTDYSPVKTAVFLIVTVVGACVILFLMLVFFSLLSDAVAFFVSFYREIVFRLN